MAKQRKPEALEWRQFWVAGGSEQGQRNAITGGVGTTSRPLE